MLFIKRVKPVFKVLFLLGAVGMLIVGGFFIFLDYQELKEMDLKSIYGDISKDIELGLIKKGLDEGNYKITMAEIVGSPKTFQFMSNLLTLDTVINYEAFSTVKLGVSLSPFFYLNDKTGVETYLRGLGFRLDRPIVFRCYAGTRSHYVVQKLREFGFDSYLLHLTKEEMSTIYTPYKIYVRGFTYSSKKRYLYMIFDSAQLQSFITSFSVLSRPNIFFVEGTAGIGKHLETYGVGDRLLPIESTYNEDYFWVSDQASHLVLLRQYLFSNSAASMTIYYFEEKERDNVWQGSLSIPFQKVLDTDVFRIKGKEFSYFIGSGESDYYVWCSFLGRKGFVIFDKEICVKEYAALLYEGTGRRGVLHKTGLTIKDYRDSMLISEHVFRNDLSGGVYQRAISTFILAPLMIKDMLHRREFFMELKVLLSLGVEGLIQFKIYPVDDKPLYQAEVFLDKKCNMIWTLEDSFPYKVTKVKVETYRPRMEGASGRWDTYEFIVTEELIARERVPEIFSKGDFSFEKN